MDADDDDAESARVPWSGVEIVSPHDPQARFSHKPGKVEWVGYKDHQPETCDEGRPNLIVQVVTTPAPQQDVGVVDTIHTALADQRMTPAEHLLDSGPVRQDPRAVERPGRYSKLPSGNGGTPCALDAMPPFQKPSTRTDYAIADTAVSRRPTSNTSSPPPVPTSFDSLNISPTNVDGQEAVCKS